MGSLDRRLQDLEERFASSGGRERPQVNPKVKAALDRVAEIRRKGAEASDEERAELAGFARAVKASREKRRSEGRI